ncbi:T9SS type A sorting domain-containing protein [Flavobacterium sp.]
MRLLYLLLALCPFLSQAQIQFLPYVTKAINSDAEVVAIGDVNNDGKNDVVVATGSDGRANDNKVFVFRQNANGTLSNYTAQTYLPTAGNVRCIDIADLNQDIRKDVIIGCGTLLKIFRQSNGGTLNTPISIETDRLIYSIKCQDINNDSKTDIAVSYWNNDYISVYYQTTAGNFTPQNYSLPNTMTANEVVIGDVNNDSKKDIIVNSSFPYGIYTFIQSTASGFYSPVFTALSDISGISIGDLNNDGKNDIAYSKGGNRPDSKVGILYQNNTPQLYDSPVEIAAYDVPEPIEIADLNNDNKNEIIAVHGGWLQTSVFQQSGNAFSTYSLFGIPYASHYAFQGMAVGDINSDGKKDIAVVDYGAGLVILYNSTTLANVDFVADGSTRIYPNPATDYLTIESKIGTDVQYEIIDLNGKILMTGTIKNMERINVSPLQYGFYIITIKTDQGKATYKFIKT